MHDLTGAVWRTSTRSGANGQCVEVADNLLSVVAVRDSKDRSGPALLLGRREWTMFVATIKHGEFDLPA